MTEVTIKFKDRSRSDLKLKLKTSLDYVNHYNGLVAIQLQTNDKVRIEKLFSADSIEEMTVVTRIEGKE